MISEKNDLITTVSTELGLDSELVNEVVRSQFRFVRDVMEAGEKDSVLLPYFGKMAIKPGVLKNSSPEFLARIHKSGISFKKYKRKPR